MSLYTLTDGVAEKIWPDLAVTVLGQGLSVDNSPATARVTALIPVSLLVTVTAGFVNIPLAGGSVANLVLALRAFDSADAPLPQLAVASMSIDRDTPDSGLNVAMVQVLDAGDYFDVTAESIGQTLTNIGILTYLQFWILDR